MEVEGRRSDEFRQIVVSSDQCVVRMRVDVVQLRLMTSRRMVKRE